MLRISRRLRIPANLNLLLFSNTFILETNMKWSIGKPLDDLLLTAATLCTAIEDCWPVLGSILLISGLVSLTLSQAYNVMRPPRGLDHAVLSDDSEFRSQKDNHAIDILNWVGQP